MHPADVEAQMLVYADKLMRFHPDAVQAACDEWSEDHDEFPSPKKLMDFTRECQGRMKLGNAGNADVDPLNASLDEALSLTRSSLLLEIYKLGVKDKTAKQKLINELAEWWHATRPFNGWQTEVERRCCVNAIERWLEAKFGLPERPKLAEVDPKTMRQRDIGPLVAAAAGKRPMPAEEFA